jgi:membrane peptidoglycan carboxypeptidase
MAIRKYYRTTIQSSIGMTKRGRDRKLHFWLKIFGGVFAFLFLFVIGTFAFYASHLPNPEEFEERVVEESTKVYDRTGTVLLYEAGKDIKRTVVPLDQISPYLQKATIAAEDDDFYNHPGIDIMGIARAFIFRGEKGGGSTITQQFIKNAMFLERDEEGKIIGPAPRTIPRKIQEAIMALEIERRYSKDEILEFYLNQISYGSIFYGAEAASQNYFGKSASKLTLAEAAALASLPQSPTYYLKNSEEREERKEWILDRMVKFGKIEKEEAEEAKKEKISLKIPKSQRKAPYFIGEVEKILIKMYGEDYQRMGLRILTTLDFSLQTLAEDTVSEWSEKVESWYGGKNAALVSINPNNGEVLVMVGGRTFEESQVNIWTPEVRGSFQSPGSVFKPIIYATAFKKGYTPDTILWDVKTVFNKKKPSWPENYDFKQRGPVKMKEALGQSLNIPAVKTLYLAGTNEVAETAKSMGMIESFDKKLDPTELNLSMAIGGKDIIPLELVSAFGVFSTDGLRYLPNYILKIENKRGEVIFEPEPQPVKVLDAEICRQINSILSDNNLRAPMFGSRSWLYLNSWTAAKTGTATNDKGKVIDAWTIGYTTNLVTGVWVGNNKNESMYGRVSGATAAAPIWWHFMKEATKNDPHQRFTSPKKVRTGKAVLDGYLPKTTVKIDKISGKLATDMTPKDLIEEKSFFEPHSILWWVQKDDPRGEYPRNPFDDSRCKNWEAGIKSWTEKTGGEFSLPVEKDDIHTTENKPKIEIISKSITPKEDEEGNPIPNREINFSIKIDALKGVKKIEVLLGEKKLFSKETNKPNYSFTYKIKDIGEKESYKLKIRVTDKVENIGEIEMTID